MPLETWPFQQAIKLQEGKLIESLKLLRDNQFNIEEAKKLEVLLEEALELEEELEAKPNQNFQRCIVKVYKYSLLLLFSLTMYTHPMTNPLQSSCTSHSLQLT